MTISGVDAELPKEIELVGEEKRVISPRCTTDIA